VSAGRVLLDRLLHGGAGGLDSTDAQGYFEIDLPPGSYTVRLRAFGYVSQNRRIAVEENGVTVLNVELGKK
jgi:hypothetical protein